ncbi:hypothetical protein VPNG_07322 [Cytospora leucostoma]|uniref:Rhodopsin domain-containing protein n=1 Tax=Cytospora leucostoma TaxID=1230097 RepID=A0A423WUX8_9PEZI|nr:hypothetical protein VPNG_07322 [Cytospora leucostoma]
MPKVGMEPAPPGRTPNFDSPSDLQVGILTVYVVTSFLATIGLALRFYTGAVIVRNLGIDAFLLFASWAVYLASFIGMLRVFPCGFGKHLWSVTEEQMQCYMDSLLFLGITYFWPTTLAKLSLIALYHRIDVRMGYRIALYVVACTVITYTVVFTIVLSGPCNPRNSSSGTCLNNVALAQAVLNITTDGILIIMPTFTLWNLQITRRQKITVGAIIASCVRIAYVRAMIDSPDVLYTQGSAAVWSAVEINIGILCNCLATMKPFVRRHMPWLVSFIGAVSSGGGGSGKARDSDGRFGNGRGSRASYQLHSFAQDRDFGAGHGGRPGGDGVGGGGGGACKGNSVPGDDAWLQKGQILVTTSTSTHVTMCREGDGHASTDEILRETDAENAHGIEQLDGNIDLAGKMV